MPEAAARPYHTLTCKMIVFSPSIIPSAVQPWKNLKTECQFHSGCRYFVRARNPQIQFFSLERMDSHYASESNKPIPPEAWSQPLRKKKSRANFENNSKKAGKPKFDGSPKQWSKHAFAVLACPSIWGASIFFHWACRATSWTLRDPYLPDSEGNRQHG